MDTQKLPTKDMTDEEMVRWFAAAGVQVTVVDRCGRSGCTLCDRLRLVAAA